VIERLKDEYEVGDAELAEHVARYVTELEGAGVIEPIQS
jgi:hypothetical protein